MSRLPVTLCVSTRNAGAQLRDCVETVGAWVSEIVVVDMASQDDTVAVAAGLGAVVVSVPPAGWAEPGRQAGIDAATQPWVLVLDADERAASGLEAVVAAAVSRPELAGLWLPRQNFQFGWWVTGAHTWPDWQLRLFRRDRTTWPGHRTHVGAVVDGHVERAPADPANAIIHLSYRTMSEWLGSTDRYTDLEAGFEADRRRFSPLRLLVIPWLRFLEAFVRGGGFRGGRYGLVQAVLSAIYWALAEIKHWERELGREQLPPGTRPDPRGR